MKYFFLSVIAFIFFSCTKEKQVIILQRPANCDSLHFTFNHDIGQILSANCNFHECHASGGDGSYDFSKYTVVADRIRAGTFIYRLDLPLSDPQHMPQNFRLSDCDYFQIKTWISQGYSEK